MLGIETQFLLVDVDVITKRSCAGNLVLRCRHVTLIQYMYFDVGRVLSLAPQVNMQVSYVVDMSAIDVCYRMC